MVRMIVRFELRGRCCLPQSDGNPRLDLQLVWMSTSARRSELITDILGLRVIRPKLRLGVISLLSAVVEQNGARKGFPPSDSPRNSRSPRGTGMHVVRFASLRQ